MQSFLEQKNFHLETNAVDGLIRTYIDYCVPEISRQYF